MTTLIMTREMLLADTAVWDDARSNTIGAVTKIARSRDRWWAAGAGHMAVVQSFLDWFRGISVAKTRGVWRNKNIPDVWPDATELLLLSPHGDMFFFEGFRMVHIEAPYVTSGSGGSYAAGAMEAGRTPLESMIIAAKLDAATGGAIDVAVVGAAEKVRNEIYEQIRSTPAPSAGGNERPVQQGRGPLLGYGVNRLPASSTIEAKVRS